MSRNYFIAFWMGGFVVWGALIIGKLFKLYGERVPWVVAWSFYLLIFLGAMTARYSK